MADTKQSYTNIRQQFGEFARLYIRYAKLTVAEKVTVFLTAAAVAVAAFVFSVIFIFYMSLAIAWWISPYIGIAWAYALISFVYLLLIALLFIFRKPLIMNPISRFISRLFLS
ncbi:MAG: phage holin family protein [Muribaculaceae bacterium]|jgi:hypothetical protein|nr:phage holin family protein [Muribaculaceae bacterium]